MDYQEAIQIIKEKSCDCNHTFLVSGNEGVDKTRLFISTNGKICRFMPRSQKRGYPLKLYLHGNHLFRLKAYMTKEKWSKNSSVTRPRQHFQAHLCVNVSTPMLQKDAMKIT